MINLYTHAYGYEPWMTVIKRLNVQKQKIVKNNIEK